MLFPRTHPCLADQRCHVGAGIDHRNGSAGLGIRIAIFALLARITAHSPCWTCACLHVAPEAVQPHTVVTGDIALRPTSVGAAHRRALASSACNCVIYILATVRAPVSQLRVGCMCVRALDHCQVTAADRGQRAHHMRPAGRQMTLYRLNWLSSLSVVCRCRTRSLAWV